MTDEAMVEDWIRKNCCEWCLYKDDCDSENINCFNKNAFLAGLKAGRPEWHDLRKDPNDLPKKTGEYLTNIGMLIWDYYADGRYRWHTESCEFCDCFDDVDSAEVIAWCEIPKFKEIKEK